MPTEKLQTEARRLFDKGGPLEGVYIRDFPIVLEKTAEFLEKILQQAAEDARGNCGSRSLCPYLILKRYDLKEERPLPTGMRSSRE